MTANPTEALAQARRLSRTLPSAPLPQNRAREIFHVLARAQGWTLAQELAITDLGLWLETRPAPTTLKARCEQVLDALQT